jgi:hypothetical protein
MAPSLVNETGADVEPELVVRADDRAMPSGQSGGRRAIGEIGLAAQRQRNDEVVFVRSRRNDGDIATVAKPAERQRPQRQMMEACGNAITPAIHDEPMRPQHVRTAERDSVGVFAGEQEMLRAKDIIGNSRHHRSHRLAPPTCAPRHEKHRRRPAG